MNIVIACGGTGGHLFPGLAVAETLLQRGHRVRLVVSERPREQEWLQALPPGITPERLDVHPIAAVGLNGSRRALSFGYGLAKATAECAWFYRGYAPDVVLGMGGFTSAPAVLAARSVRPRRTMTLIHESNAIPGRANRFVGRFVHRVAVGLADCGRHFPGQSVVVTGTPIRAMVRQGDRVADAQARLGLQPGKATVLVMGGSQGAHAINEGLACTLPWLDGWADRVQFLHLSGTADAAFVREVYDKNGFAARVLAFCHQMDLAYSAADVVIARAGAATLAELAAYGLPSILVPYPHATGNHQWHNARVFQAAGAARLYTQRELESNTHAERGERLAGALIDILGKPDVRQRMVVAARSLAYPDATERIADLVEECGQSVAQSTSRPNRLPQGKPLRVREPAVTEGAYES